MINFRYLEKFRYLEDSQYYCVIIRFRMNIVILKVSCINFRSWMSLLHHFMNDLMSLLPRFIAYNFVGIVRWISFGQVKRSNQRELCRGAHVNATRSSTRWMWPRFELILCTSVIKNYVSGHKYQFRQIYCRGLAFFIKLNSKLYSFVPILKKQRCFSIFIII